MRKSAAIFTFLLLFILPYTAWAATGRPITVKADAPRKQQLTEVPNVLKDKTIVIDPGHGGNDPGAIGNSGLAEKDVTLAISTELSKLLTEQRAEVILTRDRDKDVAIQPNVDDVQELQSRVNVANKLRADVFVSIHVDSFSDKSARGTTTYFYPKTSRDERLAILIQQSMVEQLGLLDRGAKQSNFYVLKHTAMPAILAEVAFISNPAEEALLNQSDFIKKAANGIFAGITKFFEQ